MNETQSTLRIVTTDYGADCDDQKAISDLIQSLHPAHADLAFIVNGPHPHLAAQAIAEKYYLRMGAYPLIGIGTPFEQEKKPAQDIFSLIDGVPMLEKRTSAPVLTLEEFQTTIDDRIKSGRQDHLEIIVLAPLHNNLEYYNPRRAESAHDVALQQEWKRIKKIATLQFQRTENGHCQGNNYQKSAPGIAEGLISLLEEEGIETVFFEGAVSKRPEFLMQVMQSQQIGLQKAAESYITAMQVPWLYMTEPIGVTPSPRAMHAGMFTAAAQFPFGAHVAGATAAGFGAERALKEICGISKEDTRKFDQAFAPIAEELDRFDSIVLQELRQKYPQIQTLAQMRYEMHCGMMTALQCFAEQKAVIESGEKLENFRDMFAMAKAKNIPLNAYDFMSDFEQVLFSVSPVTKDITTIATDELRRPHHGKTHLAVMSNALTIHGASAIIYDAVTIAAAEVIRENGELKPFFNKHANGKLSTIDINMQSIEKLKADRYDLYASFVNSVRKKLTLDGTTLTQRSLKINSSTIP